MVKSRAFSTISNRCPVRLKVNGAKIFFGFVFKQQRSKKEGKVQEIAVTAYDQLRYLNNKDTRVYENKTADQVVKMIADDYRLSVGTLKNTEYVIPSRVEDNHPSEKLSFLSSRTLKVSFPGVPLRSVDHSIPSSTAG